MGKRIHRNDEVRRRFVQIDKILLENPKYEKLSEGSILAYGILRDRLNLSKENADVYSDSEGFLYVIYTDEELGYLLHRTRQTANARKKELEKFGLLEMVRGGFQEPNRIYICDPDVCDPSDYISNRYKEKLEKKYLENEKRKIERYRKKYLLIEVPGDGDSSYPQDQSLEAQQMSKSLTSVESKKSTTTCKKNRQVVVEENGTINTKENNTKNNETEIFILFDDDKEEFEINLLGLQKLKDILKTDNPEFLQSIIKKMKELKIPFFYEWEIHTQLKTMHNYEEEFETIFNRGAFFVQGIANMRHSTNHSNSRQQVKDYIKKQEEEKEKQRRFSKENHLTIPFYNWLES